VSHPPGFFLLRLIAPARWYRQWPAKLFLQNLTKSVLIFWKLITLSRLLALHETKELWHFDALLFKEGVNMKSICTPICRAAAAFLVITAFTLSSFGQKAVRTVATTKQNAEVVAAPNASVTPVRFLGPGQAGNPSCATLNGLHTNNTGDTRFSHIINDYELRLDFSNPNGTFPFTSSDPPMPRIVIGPQSASATVTISSDDDEIFSWSSTRLITAVIMKMGNDAFVYPYKPFSQGDSNLRPADTFPPPPGIGGLSHVTFCFAEPTGPTAGEATLTGRVVDASGYGIAKAQLVLINGATGESKITMTNPFGYYSITGLDVDEVYVLNVAHKRYTFEERQRTIVLTDSATTSDFVAQPQ
jgi:hypothetical protein